MSDGGADEETQRHPGPPMVPPPPAPPTVNPDSYVPTMIQPPPAAQASSEATASAPVPPPPAPEPEPEAHEPQEASAENPDVVLDDHTLIAAQQTLPHVTPVAEDTARVPIDSAEHTMRRSTPPSVPTPPTPPPFDPSAWQPGSGSTEPRPGGQTKILIIAAIVVGGLCSLGSIAGLGIWVLGRDSGDEADKPAAAAKPAAEPREEPDPFTGECWDGSQAGAVSECPPLTGPEAMTWVFPQSAGCRSGDSMGISGTSVVRNAVRICSIQTSAGPTEVTYSEYASADDLQTAMDYIYANSEPEEVGELLQYGPTNVPSTSGPAIKGTWVYGDGRAWAATAGRGQNEAAAAEGLKSVEMRSYDEVLASAPK